MAARSRACRELDDPPDPGRRRARSGAATGVADVAASLAMRLPPGSRARTDYVPSGAPFPWFARARIYARLVTSFLVFRNLPGIHQASFLPVFR
jgi:hypothetical protein